MRKTTLSEFQMEMIFACFVHHLRVHKICKHFVALCFPPDKGETKRE